jgi:hypothetical protein
MKTANIKRHLCCRIKRARIGTDANSGGVKNVQRLGAVRQPLALWNGTDETADGRRLGIIFQNANLAGLRQIGHELLTSEELTALAK